MTPLKPYLADADFTLYQGDVLAVLAGLPAESAHCCVTSPPYWGLRDYGADGQLGLEPTPEEYVANMVAVFREVRRVLRGDGTCWLNIGDSYFGTGRGPSNDHKPAGLHSNVTERGGFPLTTLYTHDTLKSKDLVGIPWRLAFALQADGWYLRSDIIWSKPNPMPESVTDRPTKAHEYLFLLSKSKSYFYDADAIREKATYFGPNGGPATMDGAANARPGEMRGRAGVKPDVIPGRNRRSVWEIATEPYPDAHFATFPQALVEPCVLAGTSERGCCPECGSPWERAVEREFVPQPDVANSPALVRANLDASSGLTGTPRGSLKVSTTGWRPTCDHGEETIKPPEPCTVLDPFSGSGTTALVARRHGRRSIGVELNPDYCALTARRLQQLSLLAA